MQIAIAFGHLHFEDIGTFDIVLAEHGYQLHAIH